MVSQSTHNYVGANGPIENDVLVGFEGPGQFENPIYTNEFDNPGIINTTWNMTPPTEHVVYKPFPNIHKTFKLYKIIPGIPCCDPFGDSFYHGDIVVQGGIHTHGPIKADGELIAEEGLIIKVPSNPNFHDPTKYDKDRNTYIPMATVKSGSITPIEINDEGTLRIHNFTDTEPTPVQGGIMFKNNEMYLGKE
jgi:hypothetical protein